MTETNSMNGYRLPAKADGSRYRMEDILAYASPSYGEEESDYVRYYRSSHRLALALQALQKQVETAVADPARRSMVLPMSAAQAQTLQSDAGDAIEYHLDATRLRRGEISADELADYDYQHPHALMKQALADPLRTARKHVTELLCEAAEKDMSLLERITDLEGKATHHSDMASNVQQLIALMADNAANHDVQQGRAA